MLNKSKILRELKNKLPEVFSNANIGLEKIYVLWNYIISKSLNYEFIKEISIKFPIPIWQNELNNIYLLNHNKEPYCIAAVDGSQIYPDRHQAMSCYLLNIGTVQICYGSKKSNIILNSEPFLFTLDNNNMLEKSEVDILRQELELKTGLSISKEKCISCNNINSSLCMIDGTIIFFNKDNLKESSKDNYNKEHHANFIKALNGFYEDKVIISSLISLPKSKDLINILRNILLFYSSEFDFGIQALDYLYDIDILSLFLKPGFRTNIFTYNGPFAQYYPEHLIPNFFYAHSYSEIVRIEFPAYIAKDYKNIELIERVILDQCQKGYGYPVVLSEAHEQAVVKNSDRDLFFLMVNQFHNNFNNSHKYKISKKSFKKKLVNI